MMASCADFPEGFFDDGEQVPDSFFDELCEGELECGLATEPVVVSSILEQAKRRARNFNLRDICRDMVLLDDSMLDWLEDPSSVEDAGIEKVPTPCKKARKGGGIVKPLCESKRFGPQVTNKGELEHLSKGFTPKNTIVNTQWAVRNYEAWCKWRVEQIDPVPVDLLFSNKPDLLNKWLSLYVVETRRQDGKKFPSKSIDCLLAGLLRCSREKNPSAVNFLSEEHPVFAGL